MKNKSILFSPWLFQSPGLQQELKSAHGDRSLMIQDLVAETVANLLPSGASIYSYHHLESSKP